MAGNPSNPAGGAATLDQLVALNDEMAALVRAGIPLERGLIDAGRDLGGRLGAITSDLGDRLTKGEPLAAALAHSDRAMPDVYRAVVEAGVRLGRLAEALEGMATLARGYAEARRSVGIALLYPLIVVLLAYGLFVGFVVEIIPKYQAGFRSLGLPPSRSLLALDWVGKLAIYWGPVPPILLLLLAASWTLSGRARSLDGGPVGSLAGRMPGVRRILDDFRSANFAQLLALLVDHHVPLAEGVRLAGEASGNRAFRAMAAAFAGRLDAGGDGPAGTKTSGGPFPPLLAWMVTAGHRQGDLPSALRHAAATYRRRAEGRADLLRAALPTALMLALGSSAVLLYGLILFVPVRALWDELAIPTH